MVSFCLFSHGKQNNNKRDKRRAEKAHLKEFVVDKKLLNTAKFKVNDEIKHNYFAHINPFGDGLYEIFCRFKLKYGIAGEILGKGQKDENDLIGQWLNSPLHKDTMLDNDFKKIGCYSKLGLTACHFSD